MMVTGADRAICSASMSAEVVFPAPPLGLTKTMVGIVIFGIHQGPDSHLAAISYPIPTG
jgi:hypothetical protein